MYLKKRTESLAIRCIALFCACVLFLTAVDLLIPRGEAKVYENLIRLHVIADGDGAEEQRIKLLVRDAIVAECGDLFEGLTDSETAIKTVNANLDRIRSVADRVLEAEEAGYKAEVVFGREDYPVREYEGFVLPSGNYYSLRVLLGRSEGQNWWCVLFPPLCFGASGSSFSDAGIDSGSSKVFTDRKYSFRFKLIELFWR